MKNFRRVLSSLNISLAALLVITAAMPAISQAQVTPSQHADGLFQAGKWAEAVKAYESITASEPDNGQAWVRLARSLHSVGQYSRAVEAGLAAVAKVKRPFVMYNLAASYARLGEVDKALDWLNQAYEAGFPQFDLLKTDADLASVRTHPRFQQLLLATERKQKPCLSSTEARQFDFWLGEWEVQVNGRQVGTNSVQLMVDGCVIMENWATSQGGQTGKSLNFYNPVTRKWHQTYVDNRGVIYEMDGEYKEAALRLEGTISSARGAIPTRMTFFNLGPDKVRQLGENSNDGGKTWTVVWDSLYIRKK